MKSIKLIVLIFFIGMLYSNAQTVLFDQAYYFIAKDEIKKIKQVQDSILVFECKEFQKCNSTPNYAHKILRDSIINKNSKMVFLGKHKYDAQNLETKDKKIMLVDTIQGRKILKEFSAYTKKERTQKSLLYSTSELIGLRPISEITKTDADHIYEQMVTQMKASKMKQPFFNEYKTWELLNDLIIAKGYSPVGAREVLQQKSDKF
ncbi:hypothetical protein [uncultured Kordia sp.]|uniref:hypothetical protein n=1 Tax=uncultured Kordia sp. TaxID=507699 RepID=UPI0026220450|nr:hypothetical protein [uncultured Kordia sp.]